MSIVVVYRRCDSRNDIYSQLKQISQSSSFIDASLFLKHRLCTLHSTVCRHLRGAFPIPPLTHADGGQDGYTCG